MDSTYRLQVNGDCTLYDAAALADYLADLGAGAVYTSPILRSTAGSEHGYDVVAHDVVDREAGGRAGLDALVVATIEHGLRLVVDVVPNHVSVGPPEDANPWWWDLLRHGRESRYARAFDVDWARFDGRVLLPVLDRPLADVLAAGEIVRDGDVLRWRDHVWPVAPGTAHDDGEPVADLLHRQHYLPEYWRHDLNYRRFFDISSLAAIRVEDEHVFAESHALVLALVGEGKVDGLRIDHVDGLADPARYLHRLAEATGGVWTVVEKILEPGERLPDWPVAGTTGYDALSLVTGLFVDPDGEAALTRTYADVTGATATWDEVAAASKRLVLTTILRPEVDWLHRLVPAEPYDAIVELLVALDVYRSTDPAVLGRAADRAAALRPDLRTALDRLVGYLTHRMHPAFATRFQQVSGPAMAKGVEDTAFYRYHRLVALNEVGCSPGTFGVDVAAFHAACSDGSFGMTTLSTHDTKRGEDVRARLALLSEIPDEWDAAVRRWMGTTEQPDANFRYLMLQTFVGAWPLDRDRALAYALKAAREAKQHTSWLDPDEAYEHAVEDWVRGMLGDATFVRDLEAFVAPLVVHGWTSSLAQKLVQLTMPGVPDVYQGTEVWNLLLVDPDNRRPVDFALRRRLLAEVDTLTVEQVGERAAEGLPKLLVTSRALRLRRARPEAFAGSYSPLDTQGAWADRVVAFARGETAITVVPRLSVPVYDWKDTMVALPPGSWRNVLTGDAVEGGERSVAEVFARFPVALLDRA